MNIRGILKGFPGGASGKEPARQCRRHKRRGSGSPGDPLEKEMATHSSILTWRIPWTEELASPQGHKKPDMTEET